MIEKFAWTPTKVYFMIGTGRAYYYGYTWLCWYWEEQVETNIEQFALDGEKMIAKKKVKTSTNKW